jgi:hypothetical protein
LRNFVQANAAVTPSKRRDGGVIVARDRVMAIESNENGGRRWAVRRLVVRYR